jgi:GH24 family phage-related lysozyme (muramidase)
MSGEARTRMRVHERKVYQYYDDGGPGRGNCTWGIGILAHHGPCSRDELRTPVSDAQIETEFTARLAAAERIVRRNITNQALTQSQFDALVSFTYNVGETGGKSTFDLVNDGEFEKAASKITDFVYIHVRRKGRRVKVIAHGLIQRRAEESAPFRASK